MALPTRIEPVGPWLSKTPSSANVGAKIISKYRRGLHDLVDSGWWMRKIRVKRVPLMNLEGAQHRCTGINVDELNSGRPKGATWESLTSATRTICSSASFFK